MEKKEMLKNLTAEEKRELLTALQTEENTEGQKRKDAYESIRSQFIDDVEKKLILFVYDVNAFRDWIEQECNAFLEVMKEYGKLRNEDQRGFTAVEGNIKVEVKSCKVKSFDERADIAAERLIDYLKRYVSQTTNGIDDPMYQLAMTLLERNKQGDLDYKSISKLYDLESKFDAEYAEIMNLFKESNVVYKTATNYYFHKRDNNGVWKRIEPSFCRL